MNHTPQKIVWHRLTGGGEDKESFEPAILHGRVMERVRGELNGVTVVEDELLLPPVPIAPGDELEYEKKRCRVCRVRRCTDLSGSWRGCRCTVLNS